MVSIIVPIYNVELYLQTCIESILAQTYTELEFILVDDGSTDTSGIIADSYTDSRIRVYHTENHGLSAARNLGIEQSSGDYIFFIDADDWIEPDAISIALSSIGTADILCFNFEKHRLTPGVFSGQDAMIAVLNYQISTTAWGKLFRKECFSSIRFPEGRIHEDAATIYKVLSQASMVNCIDYHGYHYRYRSDSLSHTHDKKNIMDFWFVHRDRYEDCKKRIDEKTKLHLLELCALAIARAWAWRNSISELKKETIDYNEMQEFARKNLPHHIRKSFPLRLRIGLFFVQFNNPFSFLLANASLRLDHLMRRHPIADSYENRSPLH